MEKNLNLKDFPGLVLLPDSKGNFPALPPPKTSQPLVPASSYYVPYHNASYTRQSKINYCNWQKKLKLYLDTPHPGIITCVRSLSRKSGFFIPFMKNEFWMNSDTIPFDWMNMQGICHPISQLVYDKQMPKTLFIDLTEIDDITKPFYKSLKYVLDGIAPPTQKFHTTLFEFQNIVIFGNRYPAQLQAFDEETWNFFEVLDDEIYILPYQQAVHEVHRFHGIEFRCPCFGCVHTRAMREMMKELLEARPLQN